MDGRSVLQRAIRFFIATAQDSRLPPLRGEYHFFCRPHAPPEVVDARTRPLQAAHSLTGDLMMMMQVLMKFGLNTLLVKGFIHPP